MQNEPPTLNQQPLPQNPNPKQRRTDNSKFGRLIESPIFWVLFVVFAFGLPIFRSVTRDAPKPLPVLAQVGDFTLTNQDGKVAHWSDYRGSVLVVNFIFTTCPNICPLMSMQMAKLQSRLIRSYPAIRLVSISVDPSTDTPDVLKAYGEKYRAEPRLWTFLTGPLDEIQKVVVKGFQMSRVVDGADESNLMSITHGENFIIVDQLGQIRAYRQANNEQDLNSIMRDVAFLANTKPSLQKPTGMIDAGNPMGR